MQQETIKQFDAQEHSTWKTLYGRLEHCRQHQAHPLYAEGIRRLDMPADRIPPLDEINKRLKDATGWQGVPVQGLEGPESFFAGLKDRRFPIGNFIREPTDLSYTPAPDIFHDLYGHLPFFMDPDYGDFCQRFGAKAAGYFDRPDLLRQFERVFWFGVEFPLIRTEQGVRIFGGGILSSWSESNYALSDEPEVLPFDLEQMRRREYRIDEIQKTLFVLNEPGQLYACPDELDEAVRRDRQAS